MSGTRRNERRLELPPSQSGVIAHEEARLSADATAFLHGLEIHIGTSLQSGSTDWACPPAG
jgi:hypothetical protein